MRKLELGVMNKGGYFTYQLDCSLGRIGGIFLVLIYNGKAFPVMDKVATVL